MVSALIIKETAEAVRQIKRSSAHLSIDTFKYDFVNLSIKIILFFAIAYAINKIFEAIISASGFLISFVAFFGLHLPQNIPEPVRNFFLDGFKIGDHRVSFWDIIKIISTLLVIVEMFNYLEEVKARGNKPSPYTLGVFGILITGLALITFPEIISRVQEIRAMNDETNSRIRDVR